MAGLRDGLDHGDLPIAVVILVPSEPMVHTPHDAITCVGATEVDHRWLGPFARER